MRSVATGCWTCRVRHRKCDLEKPSCRECTERHVRCHGYGPKPAWMDGGLEEQKERSRIKATINKNFRNVKKMQHLARRTHREKPQTLSETQGHDEEMPDPVASPPRSSYLKSLPSENEVSEVISDSRGQALTCGPTHDIETYPEPSPRRFDGFGVIDHQEACLLMHYLDQVFPWQFPYHDSRSRLGNRGWLFLLLIKRGPLYHAALSLSSLHQSAILGTEEDIQRKQEALNHHSTALRELCDIMSEKGDKLRDDHAQLAEFLTCSFMLISFEVFSGAEHGWLLHLDAIASVMRQLSPEDIFNSQTQSNTDIKCQSNEGLEFLMVGVMWYDLFACISTGSIPRPPYQRWLQTPGFNTADLMGCQNWVMMIIGDLAHLSAWKYQQEKDGRLSIRELASKGQEIETRLESGIENLERERDENTKMRPLPNWVSHIFALAALILLHTIVSGPLPALPEIQSAVARSVLALENRPKTYSLTGSVWALCIIACMAQSHRPFFETLMTDLTRESGRFGNIATVQKIMRKCWEMQETGRADCRITMSEMGVRAILI